MGNEYAARGAFADYLARKAENTIRRQAAFLTDVGLAAGDLQHEPEAWQGVTWGLVEGFRNWMVAQGDAVGSINVRLSTVKAYARLAVKAGALTAEDFALIRMVAGYSRQEGHHVNERRAITRRGHKKAQHVSMDPKQARRLKNQPDTPQGRRDALLMCLLLDHGLRVGEVARLKGADFDLKAGELRFYRPKVDKEQTHKLTADTLRAARG